MNILILDSWLREFLDTNATPKDIQKCLSLCGPSIEKLSTTNNKNSDYIYDVEVTTNRVDCMSIIGIAREAAAILPRFGFTARLKLPKITLPKKGSTKGLSIDNDFSLCQRVMALKVENISVLPSPDWLKNRLEAVGVRSLNNLVDITNYVMWETGHPTHVFDFDCLDTGKMIIRVAKKAEAIITLDGKTHELLGGEVVIDDGTGKIIDLPSIMGTKNSVVRDTTSTALFFIDDVASEKVRFASMRHGIRTQAAVLMEKDVDPNLAPTAISRTIDLINQIIPSAKISVVTDIYQPDPSPKPISISLSQISILIGVPMKHQFIMTTLKNLGFTVKSSSTKYQVIPPSWRARDVQIPEDVIEEIARIYGYHETPSLLMSGPLPTPTPSPEIAFEDRLKISLKYLGFTEVYSYSLVAHDPNGLRLANPLSSDWQYLRTKLSPSHKQIIQTNHGRVGEINLFEIAHVYLPQKNDLPTEENRLIISTTNKKYRRFKGIISTLFTDLNIKNTHFKIESQDDFLYFETPIKELLKYSQSIKPYTPVSPYMPIVEDINIPIASYKSYAELTNKIYSLSSLISNISFVDLYQDKLTLRITYHSPDHQLSTSDIAPIRTLLSNL